MHHDEPEDRVLASMVAPLVAGGVALGLDPIELTASIGVSADELRDPDALVSYEVPLRLWEALVRSFPAEPLGLRFAQEIDEWAPSSLGVVGYVTRNCRDVRQALELFIRFTPLSFPRMQLRLEELRCGRLGGRGRFRRRRRIRRPGLQRS